MTNNKNKEEQKERKEFFKTIREAAKRINLSEYEAVKLAEEAKKWARSKKQKLFHQKNLSKF